MITFVELGNRIATENFEIGEIYTITFTNGDYKTMCCIGVGSDFVMFQYKLPNALFCLTLGTAETVSTIEIGGGGSGTMNYNELENKPQINGIVLVGNKTAADLNLASTTDLSGKQDTLTETQLTAVNSGITSSLVTQIGTNTTAISGKQDQLSTTQLTAVNSGITSSLVTQIGTNTTAISGKQDQLSTAQLTAVNSGITSADVTQITTNKNNILSTQTQISYNTNTGVKNLLNNIAISGSQKGVTYTVNADGSVSTSGSTTSDLFILTLGTFTFVQGKTYYITGCPLGGSTTGYSITNIGTTYFYDTGNGATVTGDGQTRTIAIYAPQSGTNMDGLTFKPMIREIGDDTYQPYAMSNAEITAWIKAHT